MADGYLEKHYEDYEARRDEYLRRKRHVSTVSAKRGSLPSRTIERPDDEAL